jgi:hypothetical protein
MALNDAAAVAVFPAAKPVVRAYALRAAGLRSVSSVCSAIQSSLGQDFVGLARRQQRVD